jgi:hypothetical protein
MPMLTKLNFTGRQKILREHVKIEVVEAPAAPLKVRLHLELSPYKVPPEAELVMEAYHREIWQRWELGRLSEFQTGSLWAFPSQCDADGLHFRVLAVSPRGTERQIICEVDRLTGTRGETTAGAPEPILPVRRGELGSLVWKLELDEPTLVVNSKLGSAWRELARGELFQTLVYPEVMRQALRWAVENLEKDGEESTARRWVRFAEQLPGVQQFADSLLDDENKDQLDRWIEESVDLFCREKCVCERFIAEASSEGVNQ